MKVKNSHINEIRIYLNRDLSVKEIKKGRYKVLGQNEKRLVIDDLHFSSLELKKNKDWSHRQYVGEISVYDYTKDKYFSKVWGDFVVSCHYYDVSTKILQNRINKAVDKFIFEKIGAYIGIGKSKIVLGG